MEVDIVQRRKVDDIAKHFTEALIYLMSLFTIMQFLVNWRKSRDFFFGLTMIETIASLGWDMMMFAVLSRTVP